MKGFSCLRRRKAQGGRALVVQVLCVALNWLQNSLGKKKVLELSLSGNVFTGFTQLMKNCAADKLLASKENIGEVFRNSCLNALPFQWFHSSGCREFLVLHPCFPPPEQKGLDPPALPSQRASSSSKSDEISLFHITVPKTLTDMESGSSWMRSCHNGLKVSPSSVLSFPLQKPQMQSWQSLSHTFPSASEALGSQSATLAKSHCPQIPHKPRTWENAFLWK